MNKHTPTPWELVELYDGDCIITRKGDTYNESGYYPDSIAFIDSTNGKVDAEHMVKCVNEHEALKEQVAELENIVYWVVYENNTFDEIDGCGCVHQFLWEQSGREEGDLTKEEETKGIIAYLKMAMTKHNKGGSENA